MANTSRKRPAPRSAMAAANGNGSTAATATLNGPLPAGIDSLLAKYARHLPPGGSVSIRLIKGPTSSSVDPIAARQAARKVARAKAAAASSGVSSGNDSDGNTNGNNGVTNSKDIAAPLQFPRMAKFSETVTPPDFSGGLKDGRIYEEEVPKAKDESDEEESTAYTQSNAGATAEGADPNNPSLTNASSTIKKKKRRWRRNDPRPRRWVLQDKEEFFDRIRKRRQRASSGGAAGDDDDEQGLSNQYHGVLESNASKYIILSVAPPSADSAAKMPSSPSSRAAAEQISIQPIAGFHTFSQPHKHAGLSMEEAESAIESQRNVVTRYMMHGKLASQNNSSEAKAALASGVASVGGRGRGRGLSRSLGPAPKAMSRARLLGKLSGGGGPDEDDDDVMGDVRFSSSKGGGSRARKELLTSMGNDLTADDDGVLGGANDSEFGGRRRFGRVAVNKDNVDNKKGSKDGKGGATSTGFEAGAMEEGFYQRDVAAEYEALDYDANEQFDDDDVNVGEDEIVDTGGGFGGGDYDSDNDGLLDSDDGEVSDEDDFQGMASSSGLKAMLARARGESPQTAGADSNSPATGLDALDPSKGPDAASEAGKGGKAIGKMLESAKKISEEMEKKKPESTVTTSAEDTKSPEKTSAGAASASPKTAAEIKAMGIEKDKDGKRLITLEAVRREIWLNNGAITSKRLTKKFEVNKKNPERQALFKTIVMELCSIKKDADGNKLVLKQHYSKI